MDNNNTSDTSSSYNVGVKDFQGYQRPPAIEFKEGISSGTVKTNQMILKIVDSLTGSDFLLKKYDSSIYSMDYVEPYQLQNIDQDNTSFAHNSGFYIGLFYPVYIVVIIFVVVIGIRKYLTRLKLKISTCLEDNDIAAAENSPKKKFDHDSDDIIRI